MWSPERRRHFTFHCFVEDETLVRGRNSQFSSRNSKVCSCVPRRFFSPFQAFWKEKLKYLTSTSHRSLADRNCFSHQRSLRCACRVDQRPCIGQCSQRDWNLSTGVSTQHAQCRTMGTGMGTVVVWGVSAFCFGVWSLCNKMRQNELPKGKLSKLLWFNLIFLCVKIYSAWKPPLAKLFRKELGLPHQPLPKAERTVSSSSLFQDDFWNITKLTCLRILPGNLIAAFRPTTEIPFGNCLCLTLHMKRSESILENGNETQIVSNYFVMIAFFLSF